MKLKQSVNCKAFKTYYAPYDAYLLQYILSAGRHAYFDDLSLQNVAFETKLLRTMYKKRFGQQLQQQSSLRSCQIIFGAMTKSRLISGTNQPNAKKLPYKPHMIQNQHHSQPRPVQQQQALFQHNTNLHNWPALAMPGNVTLRHPLRPLQQAKPLLVTSQTQDLMFCQNLKTVMLKSVGINQFTGTTWPGHACRHELFNKYNICGKQTVPSGAITTNAQARLYNFASLKQLASNKKNLVLPVLSLRQIPQLNNANFMAADWVLQHLIQQFNGKKSVRPVLNHLLNDASKLMRTMASGSALMGLRVTLTGRLGARKKGMAQQITRSVGTVPLSTLRQKIDYSQGFISTRLGVIGVKVWVCYA